MFINFFQASILIGLFGGIGIGLFVLGGNSKRSLNRYFFLSTLCIVQWLLIMFVITFVQEDDLLFWTRLVTAAALLLPIGYFILRCAIVYPGLKPSELAYHLRFYLWGAGGVALLCMTPWVIRSARFAGLPGSVPVNDYGPGFLLYVCYFVLMAVAMITSFRNTIRNFDGVQRVEVQFLLLGWLLGVLFGLTLFVTAIVTGNQEATQFLPLFSLILNGFVAYGIATKRILSVSEVLQRTISYGLVVLVLVAAYWASFIVGQIAFRGLAEDSAFAAHVLAALVLAFLVVPTQRQMHVWSQRLFFAREYSGDEILAGVGSLIQEIATESELMSNFVQLIRENFGATQAILLRPDPDSAQGCRQAFPPPSGASEYRLPAGNALVELLKMERAPVSIDMLSRMRPGDLVRDARIILEMAQATVAIGGFLRNEMKAVLILGPKRSGRIYDLRNQRVLQLLCDQFAVALENANLYTAVQDGKIYNEILLNSLTSGIVAVDSHSRVTVFNLRARELTGLEEHDVVNHSVNTLPKTIRDCLCNVLDTKSGFRDHDLMLTREEEEIPIRISGEVFHSHTGKPLGALVTFTDLTELKQMEEQIRRSDRLSSIGTLSAGMAHEIKNPLVSIKTFTQLLPEQYDRPEFRETFFSLVGQEVKRIDTLVNQLLHFARPEKSDLRKISLHQMVRDALRLVEQQLEQGSIHLSERLDARQDWILADNDQLNQAFVNFFLNAIDAMPQGGELTVQTENSEGVRDRHGNGNQTTSSYVVLTVADTGVGIAEEDLHRIFDPFFTNKKHGIGLGLSVTHGILQEHHAQVNVDSQKGRGTVFMIRFPLCEAPEDRREGR